MSVSLVSVIVPEGRKNNALFQSFIRSGLSSRYPDVEVRFLTSSDADIAEFRGESDEDVSEAKKLITFLTTLFHSIGNDNWKNYYISEPLIG